jgi:hypothetical protein
LFDDRFAVIDLKIKARGGQDRELSKEPFGSPGMTAWNDSRPELLANLYKLQLPGRIPGLVLV